MKFNTKNTSTTKTVNLAGGEAFSESDKLRLVSVLLTSFVQNQYYKSPDDSINDLSTLINQIPDKKFIAKATIYARTKFGMRSISHVTAGEIAKIVKGQEWTKNFFDRVVYRPDDMLEILAYYISKYGKRPIPKSLRKGFAMALGRFNEYELAKYRKSKAEMKMVDLVNLVHPKETVAIKKLMAGNLKLSDQDGELSTWESSLTKVGQQATSDEDKEQLKSSAWEKLIKSNRLGYFALLRNLRNIMEQCPNVVDEAIIQLTDRNKIKKSLVLPFRFTTAMKEIENTAGIDTKVIRKVMSALDTATEISLDNVPKFDGETLVVVDGSGSMEGRPLQIASLFASILVKTNNADFITFSDDAKYFNLKPSDSVSTISQKITDLAESGGTNFHSIFETANKPYDRIIILSDMQGWVGTSCPSRSLVEYKQRYGASNVKIYSFDLAGYGTMMFPENSVFCLAGFSDKIFDIMKLLEVDSKALISEIEKIEI